MGNLIFFEDHHPGAQRQRVVHRRQHGRSLIPLQLALNEYNIETCFSLLAEIGRCPVFPRSNPADAGKILFLVRIEDAIAVNQQLLESEQQAQQIADRIDLIQMLENCEESLLSKAWDRMDRMDGMGDSFDRQATVQSDPEGSAKSGQTTPRGSQHSAH